MPTDSEDYYEILQIHHKAEPEIIRAAYRRLVQKYHPDKNPEYSSEMDECMKKISMAYAVLKDPERRTTYDRKTGYDKKDSDSSGSAQPQDTQGSRRRTDESKTGNGSAASGSSGTASGDSASSDTGRRRAASGGANKQGTHSRTGWIDQNSGYRHSGYAGAHRNIPSADISKPLDMHGWDAERIQARQRAAAKWLGLPVFFRHRLKSGGEGPVMAVIPSGSFVMGSVGGFLGLGGEKERDPNEGPQHRVSLAAPFAIGRFAVSFAEYDLFCEHTGRAKPSDEGWGRGNRPVVNVNWHDAWAYCRWLSQQTGKSYRLPSEAEWEYACRAGTVTPFWWSHEISPNRANYNGRHAYNRGDRGRFVGKTVPVDEYKPNPFGLYQTSGNVWEWCQDDWHKNYQGAPVDGSAWFDSASNETHRVARGGSWVSVPAWLRSAYRGSAEATDRFDDQGFRLAQS